MNQLTNLKSLGFSTRERIAKLQGIFREIVLCDIDSSGFFDVAFDPDISPIVRFVVDHVAKLVLFVSVAEADDSPALTLRSSLLAAGKASLVISNVHMNKITRNMQICLTFCTHCILIWINHANLNLLSSEFSKYHSYVNIEILFVLNV